MNSPEVVLLELGRRLGLDQPLTADGESVLLFDKSVGISFLMDPSGGLNVILHVIRVPEGAAASRAMRRVLELNFLPTANGGARFALDAGSGRIALIRRWSDEGMEAETIATDLGEMISTVEAVRRDLEEMARSTEDDPENPGETPPGAAVFGSARLPFA